MCDRDSNRTVTLILHSAEYSNRTVSRQTANQIEQSHPVYSLARVKSPSRKFSLSQITVQLESSHAVDISARIKSTMTVQIETGDPIDSLAKVKSQFSLF